MKRKYILLLIGWLLTLVSFTSVHGDPVESAPDNKPKVAP